MLCRLFKNNKSEFFIIITFALFLVVCKLLKISCIIYKVIGFKCPTCNMTSAVLALIKGDFNTYVRLNVMAVPVLIVFLGELFNKSTSKYKIFFDIFSVIILVINFIYYAYRVLN